MKEKHKAEVLKRIIALCHCYFVFARGTCRRNLSCSGVCGIGEHEGAVHVLQPGCVPGGMFTAIDVGEQAGVSSCMVMWCQSRMSGTSLLLF